MRLPGFAAEGSLYRSAVEYVAYSTEVNGSNDATYRLAAVTGLGSVWGWPSPLRVPPVCPIVCNEWGFCAPACPIQT
jgi:hypothetical protein